MAIRRQNGGKSLPLGKTPRQFNVAALLVVDKWQGEVLTLTERRRLGR